MPQRRRLRTAVRLKGLLEPFFDPHGRRIVRRLPGDRTAGAEIAAEKAAQIAAAGHRRQVVKLPEQALPLQHLDDAERERRGADAAAGQGETAGIEQLIGRLSGARQQSAALQDIRLLQPVDGVHIQRAGKAVGPFHLAADASQQR